jgi:pulcherriminic acid synthase
MSIAAPPPPDLLSAEHERDPNATYRLLLEDFPVVQAPSTGAYLVSRHADIVEVLRSPVVSTENYKTQIEPVHGRTIVTLEGKEHSKHRRLLTPFFHRGGLEQFLPRIARVARDLAEPWLDREAAVVAAGVRQRGEVDLIASFIHPYPMTVIEEMLALPKEDHEDFSRWYGWMMDFIANLSGAEDPIRRGMQAREELATYILPLIAQRRSGPPGQDDLLTMMCHAEVDGERLSDDEVRAFVSFMLVAGGETSDRAMANLFLQLLRHPDQLDAVYDDRTLLADALAETLRHTPPVHILSRQPAEDLVIEGVTIPAGSTVTCVLAAGNRDPRKFHDPDVFDIFRTDNDTARAYSAAADHLAFADGRHFCAGAMLSKAEILIGANLLLDRMENMRFAEGFEPVEDGVYTRGPRTLQVTYTPA